MFHYILSSSVTDCNASGWHTQDFSFAYIVQWFNMYHVKGISHLSTVTGHTVLSQRSRLFFWCIMNELVSERERVCVHVWMCWAIRAGVVGGIEMCAFGGLKVCVCAGVEGVLPIRTHLPLTRPSFSLVLSGKPHYMQVSQAIRERKPKLGLGMQGFLHESEREKETW